MYVCMYVMRCYRAELASMRGRLLDAFSSTSGAETDFKKILREREAEVRSMQAELKKVSPCLAMCLDMCLDMCLAMCLGMWSPMVADM